MTTATKQIDVSKIGTPLGERVLIQRDSRIKKTEEGIELPDAARAQKKTGTVLAIGEQVCEVSEKIKVGRRISWVYDLPLDVEIPVEDEDVEIVLIDANDIALILEA
jgi:co-chaperonin GroES (HSP10)